MNAGLWPICYAVYTMVVIFSNTEAAVISRPPGDLIALDGATLSLVWSVAVADRDIKWCYWRYKAGSDPTHPWVKLQVWDNMNNVIIPYNEGGPGGWEGVSGKPCSTGIQKRGVNMEYEGVYEFGVLHKNGTEYFSNELRVVVKKDTKLGYDIQIADHHYFVMVNAPSVDISRTVSITSGENITLSAAMDWTGARGDITFIKVTADGNEHLHKCQGTDHCEKGVIMENDQDNISLAIDIVPSVQGLSSMVLTQPVLVAEAASYVNIAAIILGVLFALLITGVLIAMWMFYKRRKRPHKLRDEEDLHIVPKQPDDNSLNEEPPHECMEPKLHEEIDRLKKEYDDQIVELNSKDTRLKEEYENKLRLKQEEHDKMLEQLENEHQVIIDEKEQLIDRKEIELAGATSDEKDREKVLREEIGRQIAEINRLSELNRKNAYELEKKEVNKKAELSAKKLLEEDIKRQKTEINRLSELNRKNAYELEKKEYNKQAELSAKTSLEDDIKRQNTEINKLENWNDDITKQLKAKDANIAEKDGIIRDLMRKVPTRDDNQLKSNQPGILLKSVATLQLSASKPVSDASGDATAIDSGRNKENGQEGNDEDKQLEPTKPGQEAETLLSGGNKENGQEGKDEDKQLEPTKPGQEAEKLLSGGNKENEEEGIDEDKQLEPIETGQEAETLDDTHDNRQQWERDRDELLQKVDDIMVIYQNHLKEYELPHVKEELQQIYGDIAEKLQCIDIKRKQRPRDHEYIKSLDTYKQLAEQSLNTFSVHMKSASPLGYQYVNLNKIETTLGVIKHCQAQLENMVENTQLDGKEIIRSIQMKLQMWANLNRTITGDLRTYKRGIKDKLKYLVIDQDKANTAWKTTTEGYDHFLTDPLDAESEDPSPTRDVSHNYDNQTVSNLGGHNEFPPPDMPGC